MFYDDCKTDREKAGLRKAQVAKAADISAGTMGNIEKHVPSTKETLNRVVNAMNSLHYEAKSKPLDPDKCISTKSRFGSVAPPVGIPS
jgi:DNA-binding XRE family transcriptional regulator